MRASWKCRPRAAYRAIDFSIFSSVDHRFPRWVIRWWRAKGTKNPRSYTAERGTWNARVAAARPELSPLDLNPIWKIPSHSNKATMCRRVYACTRKRERQVLSQPDRADFQYPTVHESPYRITYWIHSELAHEAFDEFIVSACTLIMYIKNTMWFHSFVHSNYLSSSSLLMPFMAITQNDNRFAYD